MTSQTKQIVRLRDLASQLASRTVYQYGGDKHTSCADVAGQTHETLQSPLDFPSIEAAIVAGDRVALAVDPNVPQVAEVVTGILKTLAMTEAGDIDIVLWDEATEATIAAITDVAGDTASIQKHDSSHRESLRYLAADAEATPIYLNRFLVDADFVLPVVSARKMDAVGDQDLTGVFPSLADSATRLRQQQRMINAEGQDDEPSSLQIPWLLGVHLIVTVNVNQDGEVASVVAGAPDAIRKEIAARSACEHATRQANDSPWADLVIASIDGDRQQQTWANAARALAAASRHVASGGTIVLWTAINQPPSGDLARLDDIDVDDFLNEDADRQHRLLINKQDSDGPAEGEFPDWDSQQPNAMTFARILAEHRVLLHSQLPRESVEPMGVGHIDDQSQLVTLSQSFESSGVLRAAQFADGTIDAPHRRSE